MGGIPKKSEGLWADIKFSAGKQCPVCGKGDIFENLMQVSSKCPECSAPVGENDIGDGAITLLQFAILVLLIPIVFAVEIWFSPPVWVHMVVVLLFCIGVIFICLPMLKTYFLLQEFRPDKPGEGPKSN